MKAVLRAPLLLALGSAAGLAGTLGWSAGSPPAAATVAMPVPGGPHWPRGDAGATARNAAMVLARPLFSRARRPDRGAARAGAAGTSPPRCAAILLAPPLAPRALFAPHSEKGAEQLALVGSVLDGGWRVRRIDAGVVDLVRAREAMLVSPTAMAFLAPVPASPPPPAILRRPIEHTKHSNPQLAW